MNFNFFKRDEKPSNNALVDEKENKALVFIVLLAILGLIGIVMYVYQDYVCAKINNKISYAYSMCATLFFTAGAIYAFGNSMGFLFGIPRSLTNESDKSKARYAGNDNLLQVSDWLTKIIIGLGLTQLNQIPHKLKHLAGYIIENTKVGNEALILFVIVYFACIGFLFGYLWTRLYFIKMLSASDNDVEDDDAEQEEQLTENKELPKVINVETTNTKMESTEVKTQEKKTK